MHSIILITINNNHLANRIWGHYTKVLIVRRVYVKLLRHQVDNITCRHRQCGSSLLGYWLMPPPSYLLFHLLELNPQAVAPALRFEQDFTVAASVQMNVKPRKLS